MECRNPLPSFDPRPTYTCRCPHRHRNTLSLTHAASHSVSEFLTRPFPSLILQQTSSKCPPYILVIRLFSKVVLQQIDLQLIGLFPIKCDVYYTRSVQGVQGTYKQRNLVKIIITFTECLPGTRCSSKLGTGHSDTLLKCLCQFTYTNQRYPDSSKSALREGGSAVSVRNLN